MQRSTLIGLGASVLLALTVVTGLFLGAKTRDQFHEISQSWRGYADDAEKKGVWISSIRGYLGYGGIIHNFKNYVLRGDEVYRANVVEQMEQFHAVMAEFLAEPLSADERAALVSIASTIDKYEAKLPLATQGATLGWPAERTDSLVRVDDTAAFQAFQALEQIWNRNRVQSTERIIAAVTTGQAMIDLGFLAMFALVLVALLIGFLMMLLLRDMRGAMESLSEELIHRRRLEQSEKLLAETVEQSPATIVITDTAGRIQYANRRFVETTGWSREELIGRTHKLLQSGDTREDVYEDIRHSLKRGETWRGVFRNLRKTGESYWAETTILPLIGGDGEVSNFIGVGEDITEKRRAREQVARAQKMEAVGLVAGGIAHDFNNILTTIVGAAHLAALDAEPGSDLAGEVDQIDIAARRAQGLVRQLLTFARREPGVPVGTDLCAVIAEVTRLLRAAIPPTIQIETEGGPGPVPVLADPTHLHQILMNLCGNAAEAIGGKPGHITIRIDRPNPADAGLPERKAGWVRLTVADDGPGMSAATLAKIFDPFFTTKPIGKGTGLGLAVVQGLVQEMGGQISAESAPGQGACLTLCLPGADHVALHGSSPTEVLPRGRERILIIDDEIEIASMFRRFLMRLGYQVDAFNRAVAGRDHFISNPDRFDLVIVDLVMPDLSGEDLAAEIRTLRPDCPILFCSAYHRSDMSFPGPEPDFIAKPVDPPQLARRVRRLLDHGPR